MHSRHIRASEYNSAISGGTADAVRGFISGRTIFLSLFRVLVWFVLAVIIRYMHNMRTEFASKYMNVNRGLVFVFFL